MTHYKRPEKHYVKPGDTVVVKCGASECMMHLGMVDKFMPVTVLENGYGQFRDPATGRATGMPNPLSWISSFYQDAERNWFGTEVYEIGVSHTVTHTHGRFYIYVNGQQTYGGQSRVFEEMRDYARRENERGGNVEVRYVENSARLPLVWSRSVVVPFDTEITEKTGRSGLGVYRDTWINLPTHFNLFAGRQFPQEG